MSLTPSQARFFRHNGFLKLPTRLRESHTEELRDTIWRDIEHEVERCSASITFPLQRQLEFPIGSLCSGTQSPGDSPGAVTAPDPPS